MRAPVDERLSKVHEAVVTSYIRSGQPVGSRYVWSNFRIGLSPASIRSVMARLEGLGLLRKPHTSAGRVPTEKGYRLYVDCLMKRAAVRKADARSISKALAAAPSLEEVLEHVCRSLQSLSHQTGIAVLPGTKHGVITRVAGTGNLVSAMHDTARAGSLLEVLESKDTIPRLLLSDESGSGTSVRIGSENVFRSMRWCSIIRSTYRIGDSTGAIGIIGPLRMEYPRFMALVE